MRKRRFVIVFCFAVAVLALVRWLWPQPEPLYEVTLLPSLGGDFTLPCAINERGQVAGFSEVAKGTYHLFLWDRDGGMQDLGPVCNNLVDISSAGQIIGTMVDPNGQERVFIWDPREGRRMLPTLGGSKAEAHAINDLSQVVGAAETDAGILHAFVWDPIDGMRDLTPSSTGDTRAWSINDAGQVIIFGPGGPALVNLAGDTEAGAGALPPRGFITINDTGAVAGITRVGPRRFDVIVWRQDAGTQRLFQVEADVAGTWYMNDDGQIVFTERNHSKLRVLSRRWFSSSRTRTFLWDPNRGRVPLDRYVAAGRTDELWPTDLNNRGCLVGAVQSTKDSRSQGVLLEPIPERWSD